MSFDWLAPHYRWMELVLAGDKLQQCRTAFLSPDLRATNVMIVGEGNGRFLVECRRVFSAAHIVCVDASQRMLQAARGRLMEHGFNTTGVEFVHADALSWRPPKAGFDLIVTHFFLDCFRLDQLQSVLNALAWGAGPRAKWLLADFQIPERGWRRRRAQLIHRLMYAFFRVVARLPAQQLTEPDALLREQGFIRRKRQVMNWGLLRSDLWERV